MATAIVDCAVYRDGAREPDCGGWRQAIESVESSGEGFVWIGLHHPTEAQLSPIAERFGLHPLAVEDAVHAHQRPKLESYDDMVFAVVKTVETGMGAHGVTIDPSGTHAYITNIYGNDVAVLNLAEQKVVATIPVDAGPNGISFAPLAPAPAPASQINLPMPAHDDKDMPDMQH